VEIRTVKNSCSRPVPSASGAPGDQAGRRLLAQGARIDSCVESHADWRDEIPGQVRRSWRLRSDSFWRC